MALPFPGLPKDKNEANGSSLCWQILGGNNKARIGANAGLCTYSEKQADGTFKKYALLFDAGLMPADARNPEDPALHDCDTVIPDLTRFLYKKGDPSCQPETPLDAIFLTHNHSDHIGALPFLALMGYDLPSIYATPYTAKRLEQEFSNAGVPPADWPKVYTIAPGKDVQQGPVTVTAFWVSHSTPQCVGYFIQTPEGNILNPGDFKLDQTVLLGPRFEESELRKILAQPVDLLLLDSTGADKDITPTTEEDVRETLRGLMEKHPDKRFIVAVMSGFEENLASVAKVAVENGRQLWLSGWSHEQALSALNETGISLADVQGFDVRVLNPGRAARDLAAAAPGDSVIVVTGAQGGATSALPRAADGAHAALKLDPKKDIILLCAPSIPGQEGSRERMLSSLRKKGFHVFTRQDAALYSQAHARGPELAEMARIVQAKTVLPVHGDTRLRQSNAEGMHKIGQKTISAENGAVIRVSKDGVSVVSRPKPRLTGFRTLTRGGTWNVRDFLMINTWEEKEQTPANSNEKRPPRIFGIRPKQP